MISTKLNEILTMLMEECDLDDRALAMKVAVPHTTIYRLRNDPDTNPTIATLQPIANFFKISIGQLLGQDPISNRIYGTSLDNEITSSRVPILKLEWVIDWFKEDTSLFREKLDKWISTEKLLSAKAFALKLEKDTYGLIFRKDSLLIIDPLVPHEDGSYVLLVNKSREIYLKQLIKDGSDIYLKSINPEIKNTSRISNDEIIIGNIVETRHSLQDVTHNIQSQKEVESSITDLQDLLRKTQIRFT